MEPGHHPPNENNADEDFESFRNIDPRKVKLIKTMDLNSIDDLYIHLDRSSENTSNQYTGIYDFLKLSNSKGSASRISGSRVSKGHESSIDDRQPFGGDN